jgi:hypothetical protein
VFSRDVFWLNKNKKRFPGKKTGSGFQVGGIFLLWYLFKSFGNAWIALNRFRISISPLEEEKI